MKRLITCLVLLIPVISVKTKVNAAILTAVVNGAWNDPSVWDLGAAPICGDTIFVPSTYVVTVSTNVNLDTPGDPLCPAVRIFIDGRLQFNAGKKMDLALGACITVNFGGRITRSAKGGGASESISIDKENWWQSSDGALDGFAESPACGIILPVELIEFTVASKDRGAELNWIVGVVKDLDYFYIEKSEDGRNWEYVSKIYISVHGEANKNFSYFDAKYNQYSTTYYRLNSVDNSGIYVLLDTQVLGKTTLEEGELTIFPNPASNHDVIALHFDATATQEVLLVISNQLGQVVHQETVKFSPEQKSYVIDSGLLNQGNYFVSLNSGDQQLKSKLTLL